MGLRTDDEIYTKSEVIDKEIDFYRKELRQAIKDGNAQKMMDVREELRNLLLALKPLCINQRQRFLAHAEKEFNYVVLKDKKLLK